MKIITAPTIEPVTLEEAKSHLRVEHDAEDVLITSLIAAARQSAEQYTNRAFLTQTLEEAFLPPASDNDDVLFRLGRTPVQSVTSITYLDVLGEAQPWAKTDNWILFDMVQPEQILLRHNALIPKMLDRVDAVKIRYVAGWSSVSDVPAPIKQAMLLMIGKWYEFREDSVQRMPTASEHLLQPYRVRIW